MVTDGCQDRKPFCSVDGFAVPLSLLTHIYCNCFGFTNHNMHSWLKEKTILIVLHSQICVCLTGRGNCLRVEARIKSGMRGGNGGKGSVRPSTEEGENCSDE